MKPDLEQILLGTAGTLVGDVAPTVSAEYAVGHLNMAATLLAWSAQEQDRAVANAAADIGEMRALFKEAAQHLDNQALLRKISVEADDKAMLLRVSELRPIVDRLSSLLIELQELVEGSDADWAVGLNRKIWTYLKATAERHALAPPQMG